MPGILEYVMPYASAQNGTRGVTSTVPDIGDIEPESPDEDNSGIGPLDPLKLMVGGVKSKLAGDSAQLDASAKAPQAELVQYFVNMGMNPSTSVQLAQKIMTSTPPSAPLANGVQIQPGAQNISTTSRVAQMQRDKAIQDQMMAKEVAGYKARQDSRGSLDAVRATTGHEFTLEEWNKLPVEDRTDIIHKAAAKGRAVSLPGASTPGTPAPAPPPDDADTALGNTGVGLLNYALPPIAPLGRKAR